jgi:YD repeat-containing protein
MMLAQPGVAKPTTGTYYWVSSALTYFSCLPTIQNGPGEGFQAITADGTKYTFDFMGHYVEPMIIAALPGYPDIARSRRVLYATKVEDRFGNWVTYTFGNTTSDQPARLTAINANDGRQITLQYDGYGHVSSLSDGSHTWTYEYTYPTGTQQSLSTVILPDASQWTIDFAALFRAAIRYYKGPPGEPYRDCSNPGSPVDSTPVIGTITHPSGATGQFTVAITRFGRTNVPMLCSGITMPTNDPNDDVSYYPMTWDAFALTSKHISGPGLATADWVYSYASTGSFASGTPVCSNGICPPTCSTDSCAGNTVVAVAGPNNTLVRYTFGNSYRYNEGKLLKVETGTPTNILRTTATTYELAQSGQPFPTPIGISPQPRSDGFTSEYLRPQETNVITQDGATFSSIVNTFDAYARPLSVTKSSSLGSSRTEVTAYSDNLSKWVLGQVSSVTKTSPSPNVVMSQTDYDANALPWKIYSFGLLQNTLTYTTTVGTQAGTLATVKDGNNTLTTLSNWKRGIPQTIHYPVTPDSPSGAIESAVVDNNGWVASTTDENGAGYTTSYGYDAMGRLASATYPTGDSTIWNTTLRNFVPVTGIEYGIPGGHWKFAVQTGTGLTTTYYDALWRPLLTLTQDTTDATTKSYLVNRYDALGRLVFTSYPVSSVTSVNDALVGTTTVYDPLGRVMQVQQDSEQGVLTTTTEYLPGFQTRVTDPKLHATTTSYQVFDVPSTDAPVGIAAPGSVSTTIVRDVFGKPLTVTRAGPGG